MKEIKEYVEEFKEIYLEKEGLVDWESEDNQLTTFLTSALNNQREEFLNQSANAHDQEVRRGLIEQILKEAPEEGIQWMQEGRDKDKKGYTEGFNQANELWRELLTKHLI